MGSKWIVQQTWSSLGDKQRADTRPSKTAAACSGETDPRSTLHLHLHLHSQQRRTAEAMAGLNSHHTYFWLLTNLNCLFGIQVCSAYIGDIAQAMLSTNITWVCCCQCLQREVGAELHQIIDGCGLHG